MFTLVNDRTGEAFFPSCRYKTAAGAKIAATKRGYACICEVSIYSYSCYNFQKKINGVWTVIK